MANHLNVTYLDGKGEHDFLETNKYEFRNKPFATSPVHELQIDSFEQLTKGEDVKTVYKVIFLKSEEVTNNFLPGDVMAILPQNDQNEINELFKRLKLEDLCDKPIKITLNDNASKKRTLKHLPKHPLTFNQLFLNYVDIRTVPKKLFLKALIKHTASQPDLDFLEKICSPAGSANYLKFITENRSLLSLLNSIPSCNPPVELILQHSSPLNPRYFSIATSPLNQQLSIIFEVLKLPGGLKGVCSGCLEGIIKQDKTKKIPTYFLKPANFRLEDVSKPLILVATGTGLAPFMGFLDHFRLLETYPEIWLFYGCRYKDRDFLCKETIQTCAKDAIVKHLYSSFSRENPGQKEYVQHKILANKEAVVDLILKKEAIVYVCGDPKTMVKHVKETLVNCFMECRDLDRTKAEEMLSDLVQKGRFLVDNWS